MPHGAGAGAAGEGDGWALGARVGVTSEAAPPTYTYTTPAPPDTPGAPTAVNSPFGGTAIAAPKLSVEVGGAMSGPVARGIVVPKNHAWAKLVPSPPTAPAATPLVAPQKPASTLPSGATAKPQPSDEPNAPPCHWRPQVHAVSERIARNTPPRESVCPEMPTIRRSSGWLVAASAEAKRDTVP